MSIVGWDPVIDEVPSACEGHETKAACKSRFLCMSVSTCAQSS